MGVVWDDIINRSEEGNPNPPSKKVVKSQEEWENLLPDDVYLITRGKGTETPHQSEMCTHLSPGKYHCACCSTLLFDAIQKFDSGTGWPSFTAPVLDNVIGYYSDHSLGKSRIEVTCHICDAHLGHVFPDGLPPSNLRYCINALALVKEENAKT